MGYYTYYTLTVTEYKPVNFSQDRFMDLMKEIEDFNVFYQDEINIEKESFTEGKSVWFEIDTDGVKWYEHKEDMKRLSANFPNILFTLEGEGEERADLWKAYFLNGKMQFCPAIITYDDFDKSQFE